MTDLTLSRDPDTGRNTYSLPDGETLTAGALRSLLDGVPDDTELYVPSPMQDVELPLTGALALDAVDGCLWLTSPRESWDDYVALFTSD